MTRYLDPHGVSLTSDASLAVAYAASIGAQWDEVGVPVHALHPGDVVVTGPWVDWSWLPAWVGIDSVPDNTPPSARADPMIVALHERSVPIGARVDPPKTARSKHYAGYVDAVRWCEEVASQVQAVHGNITVGRHVAAHAVVTDVDEARRIIAGLHGRAFGFDYETNSLDPRKVTRFGVSFADDRMAWWFPDTVAPALLDDISELLVDPASQARVSGGKYDMGVHACLTGLEPTEWVPPYDTQTAFWMWRAFVGGNDLKSLTRKYLGRDVLTFDDVGGPAEFWNQSHETQALYAAAGDARNSYDLVDFVMPRLRDDGLLDLYNDIERPCTGVLAEMELAGMHLDRARLLAIAQDFEQWQRDIIAELASLGFHGNPNADGELRRWLFDTLGLPVIERTEKQQVPSVKQDVLRRLVLRTKDDPGLRVHARACELLLDWSEVDKAMSTFVMPPLIAGWDVMHANFGQTTVVSGRLSTKPNLQNIPGHGRRGVIREAYVAPPGCELVDADYAQIEPRLCAHMSQDRKLLSDFRNGVDVYASIGRDMGFPEHELGKHAARRQNLKIVYLAWQYLTSAPMVQTIALKQGTYLPLSEARMYMEGMERSRPEFVAWRSNLIADAVQSGRVTDMWGRRRYVSGLTAIDPSARNAAARIVSNHPPQSGAGCIIKGCMPSVQALMKQAGGSLINQIHDEDLGYVQCMTRAQKDEFEHELTKRMLWYEDRLTVPLEVEIGWGKSWAEAKG